MEIRLPYQYEPRGYQIPFFEAMRRGTKRAVLVWHRRSGKDKTVFNFLVREMFRRVGNYYYMFPTYNQGRKVLWDGKDKAGFPFLGHIPEALRAGDPNNTEMKVRLKNLAKPGEEGSLFQVVGSDNIDSVVGTNPVGCVFSEYSLQDPKGWDYLSPILLENDGWAVFDYTPRGKNHGYDLYKMAKDNPEWFCEVLTVEDTFKNGGTISPAMIQSERATGKKENFIRQEYYCDFDAAIENAVFGDEMLTMRQEGRIRDVPREIKAPVDTFWDIGFDDPTAIVFAQYIRGEVRVIDYFESRLEKFEDYIKVVKEKPYIYGRHVFPHDAGYHDFKTGETTQETGRKFGFNIEIAEKLSKQDQIFNLRSLLTKTYIDKAKAEKVVDALGYYHFGYDDERKVLSRNPIHDWSSHCCDALMVMACNITEAQKAKALVYPKMGIV